MNENEKYLKVAINTAKLAGKIFIANFGKPKGVEKKGGDYRNLVTEIDKKIEKLIQGEITKKFPHHKFLGEESGLAEGSDQDLIWIVDPIDGTTNYIQGIPLCCISIALWDKKGPILGVVYNPMLNMLFTSLRGKGAYLNGKKIQVSNTKTVKESIGSFGWLDPEEGIKLYPKLVRTSRKLRVLATSVLTSALVGKGSLDFYAVSKIFIWDFAAGAAIVLEAGGKITDFEGRTFSINSKSALVSNGKNHNELLKLLK